MRSQIFRLVANRSNFAGSRLQSSIAFNPVTASAAAAAVRVALRMDRVDTDFFVTGPTMALLGVPTLCHEFNYGELITIAANRYQQPKFIPPAGVRLVNAAAGLPRVHRLSDVWPVNMTIQLRYVDAVTARLNCGRLSQDVSATLSNDKLNIQWPEWSGLRGTLHLSNPETWQDGYLGDFFVEPSSYPVEPAIAALQTSTAWLELLEEAGLLGNYAGATNDWSERLGLIALALARDTRSKL